VTGTEGENPGRFQEQQRAFWGQFGFYNLVFESLDKKYRKCMPQDSERPDNKPYLEAVLQYYKTHAVWILGVKTASYVEPIIDAMGIPCVKSRASVAQVRQ
jgi:hypothetical protein